MLLSCHEQGQGYGISLTSMFGEPNPGFPFNSARYPLSQTSNKKTIYSGLIDSIFCVLKSIENEKEISFLLHL